MKRAWLLPLALLLGVTALLFSPTPSAADSKGEIGFQARLVQDGQPIEGSLDLTFEIYDAETGGNRLYFESKTGVAVSNGLVNVTLGAADPTRFAEIWGDGHLPSSNRWITIKLGDETSTQYLLSQRIRVSSVPYSLSASAASVTSEIWDSANATGLDLDELDGRYVRADVTGPSHTISGSSAPSGVLYLEGTSDGGTQGTVVVNDPLEVAQGLSVTSGGLVVNQGDVEVAQGNLELGGVVYLENQTSVTTPQAGEVAFYAKQDKLWYTDSSGVEREVGSGAGAGAAGAPSYSNNGFRLSAQSNSPAPIYVSSSSTIYLTHYKSDEIWTRDAGVWTRHTSPQISLPATIGAGETKDVFVYWDSSGAGQLRLELSAPWTGPSTRAQADEVGRSEGVWVKSADATRRWVGTIHGSAANTVSDSYTHRYVWNVDNQVKRSCHGYAWKTTVFTGNGSYQDLDPNNRVNIVTGLESHVSACSSFYNSATTNVTFFVSVGMDGALYSGYGAWAMPNTMANAAGSASMGNHRIVASKGKHDFAARGGTASGYVYTVYRTVILVDFWG